MTTEKYMEESIKLHSQGYIYAGLILGKNGEKDYHLWLHPEIPERLLTWHDAMAWAGSINCNLPNRREQSLLFANRKEHFEEIHHWWSGNADWYWSEEQLQHEPSYAWVQNLRFGAQRHNHITGAHPVCAVRRVYTETAA